MSSSSFGSNDNRTDVSENGAKNFLRKEMQLEGGVKATSFAYINGTGGVVLGLSTVNRGNEWDFVLKNPGNRRLYDDPSTRSKMWYCEINGCTE